MGGDAPARHPLPACEARSKHFAMGPSWRSHERSRSHVNHLGAASSVGIPSRILHRKVLQVRGLVRQVWNSPAKSR